ncbi:MAG TPA: divalent metal cation transporter, partial [Chitinophagaceae bacterium]|nr:divalent metal cation transporter [Chitinophagaceae bacterium]
MAKPDMGEVVKGFVPSIPNNTALYIAIGIIGATVMPHNLYLHSALVQTRKIKRDHQGIKRALKLNFIDSAIALNLAFFVNAGILILAAAVFFKTGRTDVGEIKQAHELLAPMLGTQLAPILFAVALIAAGQSSTITGTLAGQIVMEGYLHLRIAPWMRRLITRLIAIIPAVIVILINGENSVDNLLIFSQVILSLQLGFAIIPLIHFTSDKKTMGRYAIKPFVIFLACVITAILVYLNMKLVGDEAATFFAGSASLFWKIFVAFILLSFLALLLIALIYPMRKRKIKKASRIVHPDASNLSHIDLPKFNKIAIALDFSKNDLKLISHAIGQGHAATNYLLIHIVESAATRV